MTCDQEEEPLDLIQFTNKCNMLLAQIKEEFEDDFIGELEQPPEHDELISAITPFCAPPQDQAVAVKQEDDPPPLAFIHPKRKEIMELRQRYMMEIENERRNQRQLNEEPVKKRCRVDQTVAGRLLQEQQQFSKPKVIGNVPGIFVGDIFFSRAEMWMVGLHRQTQAGIDVMYSHQLKCNVGVSVVMMLSGTGYKDDQDMMDVVLYSGQGGATHRSGKEKHREDQKAVKGNEGLINSYQQKIPVRFIRGYRGKEASLCPFKVFYSYDGLYMVKRVIYEPGVHGNKVYKFLMERMKNQEPLKLWREPRLAIRGPGCSTAERFLGIEGPQEPSCLALPPCSTQGSAFAEGDGSCQEFMGSSCGEFGEEEPSSGTAGFSSVSSEEVVSGAAPAELKALDGFRRRKHTPLKPRTGAAADQSAIGADSLTKPASTVHNQGEFIIAAARAEQGDQALRATAAVRSQGKLATVKEIEITDQAFSAVPDQTEKASTSSVQNEEEHIKRDKKIDQASSPPTPLGRAVSSSAEDGKNAHAVSIPVRAWNQDESDHAARGSKVRTASDQDEGEHPPVKRLKKTNQASSTPIPLGRAVSSSAPVRAWNQDESDHAVRGSKVRTASDQDEGEHPPVKRLKKTNHASSTAPAAPPPFLASTSVRNRTSAGRTEHAAVRSAMKTDGAVSETETLAVRTEHAAVKSARKTDRAVSETGTLTGRTEHAAVWSATKTDRAGSETGTLADRTEHAAVKSATKRDRAASETGTLDGPMKTTEQTNDRETPTIQNEYHRHVAEKPAETTVTGSQPAAANRADKTSADRRTPTLRTGTDIATGPSAKHVTGNSTPPGAGCAETDMLQAPPAAVRGTSPVDTGDVEKEKNQTVKEGATVHSQRKKVGGFVFPSFDSLLRR